VLNVEVTKLGGVNKHRLFGFDIETLFFKTRS
jgi:hypothetical protein